MVLIEIHPAKSVVTGDTALLAQLHREFSFRDKSVISELARFKRMMKGKEHGLMAAVGEVPAEFYQYRDEQIRALTDKIQVYCCRTLDSNRIEVPTGLIPKTAIWLTDHGIPFQTFDTRNFDDLGRRTLVGVRPDRLRRPQSEGLEVLRGEMPIWLKGMGMMRIATGCGKTMLAQERIRDLGHPAIFLVPSKPILDQTMKRFERAFGLKNVSAYGGGKKNLGYVTVATYQSVYRGKPEDFEDFKVAFFDEVHHVGADTFFDVATEKLPGVLYRYGLTAFEERADGGTILVEASCGPVIYSYTAVEGISDGYLAKPTFFLMSVESTRGQWTKYKIKDKQRVAVKEVECTEYDGPDALQAYRHWVLGNDLLNQAVANLVAVFRAEGKSVLIAVDEKEHGDRLKKLIPDAGFVFGGNSENDRLMSTFNKRQLGTIIGTTCIGEGADTVPVDVLINLQGGASLAQTWQLDGRALRNEEDENGVAQKPTTLIIDLSFPKCETLNRHSGIRCTVHEQLGEIIEGSLV